MLQVKSPILYFLLLVLEIPLDLGPDVSYEQGRFSETLPKEGLEFVLSKQLNIVVFNLHFVLLPAKINPVSEKRGRKRDAFMARSSGRVKMILTPSTKVIALYMQAFIVKLGVSGL